MNRRPQRALVALLLALAVAEAMYAGGGGGELYCSDCGGPAYWEECEQCRGTGLATCFCEGEGGRIVCENDCEGYEL